MHQCINRHGKICKHLSVKLKRNGFQVTEKQWLVWQDYRELQTVFGDVEKCIEGISYVLSMYCIVLSQKLKDWYHRRRLLILAGGAETRNEKQLHTNFSKLPVIKAQFGSLINNVLYPFH